MIRMIQSRDAAHAKTYFGEALARADYYIGDQELPGYWQGKLAARLGLTGDTTKDAFFALCENRHPGTGTRLSPRVRANRTTGYDVNFHCPKSVSILHALSGDDHILTAFQESVTETMQAIEADSRTRVRVGGRQEDRPSGELVWAHFTHQTARPVEGFPPDPHLHSHCFVFNATWDPVEARIKAGQFREINRDMPYYQAQFQKVLADRLVTLGYQIRQTAASFEIEGVPQQVIDLFSKRTDQIGRVAQEKGITDPKKRGELGARTRAAKQKGASMADLKESWGRQIAALGPEQESGIRALAALPVQVPVKDGPPVAGSSPADQGVREDFARAAVRNAPRDPAADPHHATGTEQDARHDLPADPARGVPPLTAQACVDHAILHCFERASVLAERHLLETALTHAIGRPSVPAEEIKRAFQDDPRLIHVQEKSRILCTTKEVLREEKHMVELARAGQGAMLPLYGTAPEINLTGQQRQAVAHILTTPHRVSIIRGVAGSGKTTLMPEAVAQFERAGKTVTTVAPSARAARGTLKEAGFEDATTVASLLVSTTMQEKLKEQVLWVDEAGMLSTKDMTALLELTTRQNARLILAGDTRQHASVQRGDALRILNTVAKIPVAEVTHIRRQTAADYRDVVKDLSEGNVGAAFLKLNDMGCIKNLSEHDPVRDYIDVIKRGKTALMISPTNDQGEAITTKIRAALRDEGVLGKKEVEVVRLKPLHLTEAEKSDPCSFAPGQVIQFTQNAPGIQRGSQWAVIETREPDATDPSRTATTLRMVNSHGKTVPLPVAHATRFEVFDKKTIPLSIGDTVRITKNGVDADGGRLNNGDMLRVVSISRTGPVTLQNGVSQARHTIVPSFGHIAHAHCITSQSSQSRSVDEVFIFQPASTFGATDAKQFYVSVSRGRHQAHIYTDDVGRLCEYAMDLRERQSALELTGHENHKNDRHKDAITRLRQSQPERGQTRRPPTREEYEPEL